MVKWMPLKEALMYPEKYGDISKRKIDYAPDSITITLNETQTGVRSPQTFETETDHTWYATLYGGKVYLVAGETTRQKLQLRGKIGYEAGEETQRELSKNYENKELGTKGEIWSEDTIDMVTKTLPDFLRRISGIFWTAMKWQYKFSSGNYSLGFYVVDFATLYGYNGNGEGRLCYPNDNNNTSAVRVRPLVYVPDNILVDIEGLNGGDPLKIKCSDSKKEEKTKGAPTKKEEKKKIPVLDSTIKDKVLAELRGMIKQPQDQIKFLQDLIKEIEKS